MKTSSCPVAFATFGRTKVEEGKRFGDKKDPDFHFHRCSFGEAGQGDIGDLSVALLPQDDNNSGTLSVPIATLSVVP